MGANEKVAAAYHPKPKAPAPLTIDKWQIQDAKGNDVGEKNFDSPKAARDEAFIIWRNDPNRPLTIKKVQVSA